MLREIQKLAGRIIKSLRIGLSFSVGIPIVY